MWHRPSCGDQDHGTANGSLGQDAGRAARVDDCPGGSGATRRVAVREWKGHCPFLRIPSFGGRDSVTVEELTVNMDGRVVEADGREDDTVYTGPGRDWEITRCTQAPGRPPSESGSAVTRTGTRVMFTAPHARPLTVTCTSHD